MENKHRILAAAILAVGLIISSAFIKCAIDNISDKNKVVTVKGLSEMEVPADKVIYPLVFKEIGNDLQQIYENVNAKNATLTKFITDHGIASEDINIAAPEIVDFQAERYDTERHPARYNVTSVITITSHDVDKVKQIIEEQSKLLTKGIALVSGDYRYTTSYEFTKLNDIKPQMIEEATKNARAAAEKFAEDSGSKLGKIKRAVQGQFTICDRDSYTPEIKSVRVVTTIDYILKD